METDLHQRPSQPLSTDEIRKWSWQTSLETPEPSLEKGIVGQLYSDICRLYKEVLYTIFDTKDAKLPKPLYRMLESGYTCLLTWGTDYGVGYGELDRAIRSSIRLQHSTVKIMISICDILTEELIPPMGFKPENARLHRIESMADTVKSTKDAASLLLEDALKDNDTLSENSSQSGDWPTDDDLEEVIMSLKTDVECLMDMGPRFRNPVPTRGIDPETKCDQPPWDPLEHFSERIRSRFPNCHPDLVSACAKDVYDTLLRLHETREAAAASGTPERRAKEQPDSGFFSSSSLTASGPQQPAPARARDQALPAGSDLDGSSTAQTVLSFTDDDGTRRTSFPSQPKDIAIGESFPCVACGKQVAKARSPRAWKRHLLSDLRPWICCQVACPCNRKAFGSRDSWLAHLRAQHDVHPEWDDQTCPFCAERLPRARDTIIRHVELHLHEISLMALPSNAHDGEESDSGSDTSSWAPETPSKDDLPPRPSTPIAPQSHVFAAGSLLPGPPVIDVDSIQNHPVFKTARTKEDGLWHCPWEGEVECTHEPTILKQEFDGFIAQHLDSFTCKVVKGCAAAGQPFSTTECLRLHQQEVHGIHTGADRPYLCTSKGCGRAIPGNGFANQWVMEEHIRVVHRDVEGLPPLHPKKEE